MKRIITTAAALILMSGCESTGLVHDKYYIRAASVNSETGEVTFSFFSDEQEPVTVRSNGIEEALESAEIYAGKPLFTGFTELLITDGHNSREVLEYMLKEWNVSPACIVAYDPDGNSLLEEASAERLCGSLKESIRLGDIPKSDMITVLGELINSGEAEVGALNANGAYGEMIIK